MTRPTRSSARCRLWSSDLWRYLDSELPVARARAVARHVQSCAACATRARRLRAMLEECRAAGCQQLPPDVRARARARVRALLRGTASSRTSLRNFRPTARRRLASPRGRGA
jgi:anti-sigma factor RsiW